MARPCGIVTLTTDFGVADTFVGEMKGAILDVCAGLTIVDLTHDVPAHDVDAGAFLLDVASRPYPPGSVHVAVVDPGVGTDRPAVAVATERAFWVGPDNGVLARALRREAILSIHALEGPAGRRATTTTTFEGRDRFAPSGAWIAEGGDPARLGPAVDGVRIAPPAAAVPTDGTTVDVPVVHVDRFGNAYLDVETDRLPDTAGRAPGPVVVLPDGRTIARRLDAYDRATDDDPFLVFNSAGFLEVAVRRGRAADRLGLARGDRVRLRLGT